MAKNIPDSAEYLKDGVGNIVTTRTVDSEYLKSHQGTFAVDNGNGTYSYIKIKEPDFTIRKSTAGSGFNNDKVGLDGTYLGKANAEDLKVWFTWDASVANPDKYTAGSLERAMALKAMYPNYYGAETESSSSGSGVNATGDYTYTGGGNGSGNGGNNGYTPPKETPKGNDIGGGSFHADNVARSTMTFDEWLNSPQGSIFKNSSDDSQNNGYKAYLNDVRIKNGISENEAEYFFGIINKRNGI